MLTKLRLKRIFLKDPLSSKMMRLV